MGRINPIGKTCNAKGKTCYAKMMAVEIEHDKASLAEVRDEDMISWDQLPLAGGFKKGGEIKEESTLCNTHRQGRAAVRVHEVCAMGLEYWHH